MNFSPPDIIILCILAYFGFNGFRCGFIKEISKIISMIVGFVAASKFHKYIEPYLEDYVSNLTVLSIISYLIIFFIVVIIINIISNLLTKFFDIISLGWLNRLVGCILGIIKGILIVSLIIFVIQIAPNDLKTQLKEDSVLYKICDKVRENIITSIIKQRFNKFIIKKSLF